VTQHAPNSPRRLSDLSPARRRLVELMQSLHYGRIESLAVRAGEPIFNPPPVATREVKFGADAPPERGGDFLLKAQVVELLARLARLGDGTVPLIEVKGGLPFRMLLTEPVA
jgi:hypothetical protein